MKMALCVCLKRPSRFATQLPVYDFLAPSLVRPTCHSFRRLSTTTKHCSATSNEGHERKLSPKAKFGSEAILSTAPLNKPLTQEQRDFLSSALRVNQAGELAACLIYKAQTPVIVNSHPHLRPLMRHMYDQEAGHFSTFSNLIARHRVRPTVMYPLWTIAASALGWGTAIMGREAAMACTEAVETEIGGHYNEQVRVLLDMALEMETKGQELGPELTGMTETIRRIRDEELEHLDHAVAHDAQEAVPHGLLVDTIRAGCRGAIWVSERV